MIFVKIEKIEQQILTEMAYSFHIVDALPKKNGSYLDFLSRHNIQTRFIVFPDETVYQMDVFFNLAEIIPLQSHPQVKEHVHEIHRYILGTIIQQNKPYSLMNLLGFKMYVYNNTEVSFENSTLIKSNCNETLVHQIPLSNLLNKTHQCFGKTFSFVDELFHEAKIPPSVSSSNAPIWGSNSFVPPPSIPSQSSVPSQVSSSPSIWGNQSSNSFVPPQQSSSIPSQSSSNSFVPPQQSSSIPSQSSSNPFVPPQQSSNQAYNPFAVSSSWGSATPQPSPSSQPPPQQQSTWGSNWNMYQQPRFGS
jgi:hypothetical protein